MVGGTCLIQLRYTDLFICFGGLSFLSQLAGPTNMQWVTFVAQQEDHSSLAKGWHELFACPCFSLDFELDLCNSDAS